MKPNNGILSSNNEKYTFLHIAKHKSIFWYNENNLYIRHRLMKQKQSYHYKPI